MGGRKGVRKRTRKTLILVPLWFRYFLVAFQPTCVFGYVAFLGAFWWRPPTKEERGVGRGRHISGSEEGVFWRRGLFSKVHFLEILENFEILEILENPQTVKNKGESDHFLEILEKI